MLNFQITRMIWKLRHVLGDNNNYNKQIKTPKIIYYTYKTNNAYVRNKKKNFFMNILKHIFIVSQFLKPTQIISNYYISQSECNKSNGPQNFSKTSSHICVRLDRIHILCVSIQKYYTHIHTIRLLLPLLM